MACEHKEIATTYLTIAGERLSVAALWCEACGAFKPGDHELWHLPKSAVTPEEIAMLREAEKMLIQWAPFGGLGMATEIRALADRLEKGTGR